VPKLLRRLETQHVPIEFGNKSLEQLFFFIHKERSPGCENSAPRRVAEIAGNAGHMLGVMRMMQAGVAPVAYSNVALEILADNAAPEAQAVYGALGMPFAGLVYGLNSISPTSKHSHS
jgi:hypothetical protein